MKNIKIKNKGFTLIELLVVIAILTILLAIVLIAINPSRQISLANNSQRRSNVGTILNGLSQYATDNAGALPGALSSSSTQQIGTGALGCNMACGATTTVAACINLTSVLVPTYMAEIPKDPGQSFASSTLYAVNISPTDNHITVTACSAELGETISVTR